MHRPLSIGFSTMATASLRVLLGPAHALGERGVLGQHLGELVGDSLGDAGAEQTRRDGEDPDAEAAQVSGHRQRHSGDAGLRRRVGHLADLSLEGGDGRRVDDDATLAVLGLIGRHVEGLEPVQVEGADEVELNGAPEVIDRMRAFLGQGALGRTSTRGVHGDVQPAEGGNRVAQRGLDLGVVESR